MSQKSLTLLIKSVLQPNVRQNFQNANKATSGLEKRLEQLNKTSRAMKGLERAAQNAHKAKKSMAAYSSELKSVTLSKSKMIAKANSLTDSLVKQKNELKRLEKRHGKTSDEVVKAKIILERRNGALRKARAEVNKLESRERTLGRSLSNSRRRYDEQILALRKYRQSLRDANVDVKNMRREQNRLQDELAQTKNALKKNRQAAASADLRLTALAGSTAYIGGRGIISSLERGMRGSHLLAEIDVMAKLGPQKRRKIERQVVGLSKPSETNMGTMQLTEQYKNFLQAGLFGDNVMTALRVSGRATKASSAEADDVTATSVSLLKNMQIPADELERAMDIAVTAGHLGRFELRDMAKHMPALTASMKTLGQTGLDGVASLSAALQVSMNSAGGPDQGANNLKNFLAKLTSGETRRRFDKHYQVDLEEELEKAKQSGDLIGYMTKRIYELTGGNASRITDLFEDRQAKDFILGNLGLGDPGKKVHEDQKSHEEIRDEARHNSKGAVDQGYKTMVKEPLEQWIGTVQQFEGLTQQVGKRMLPPLNKVVTALNSASANINVLFDKVPVLGSMLGVGALHTVGAAGALALASPAISGATSLYAMNSIRKTFKPLGGTAGGSGGKPGGLPVRVTNWPRHLGGSKQSRTQATSATMAAGAGVAGATVATAKNKAAVTQLIKEKGIRGRLKGLNRRIPTTLKGGLAGTAAHLTYEVAKPAVHRRLRKAGVDPGAVDTMVNYGVMGSFLGPKGALIGVVAATIKEAIPKFLGDLRGMKDHEFLDFSSRDSLKAHSRLLGWTSPHNFALKTLGINPLEDRGEQFVKGLQQMREARFQNDAQSAMAPLQDLKKAFTPSGFVENMKSAFQFKPEIRVTVNGSSDPQEAARLAAQATKEATKEVLEDPSWLEALVHRLAWPLSQEQRNLLIDGGMR